MAERTFVETLKDIRHGDVIGEWRMKCDGCGDEATVIATSPEDADLIVALRSLAPEVVALLRAKVKAAEIRERTVPGFRFKDHAMDRIVLGETEMTTPTEGTTTP